MRDSGRAYGSQPSLTDLESALCNPDSDGAGGLCRCYCLVVLGDTCPVPRYWTCFDALAAVMDVYYPRRIFTAIGARALSKVLLARPDRGFDRKFSNRITPWPQT